MSLQMKAPRDPAESGEALKGKFSGNWGSALELHVRMIVQSAIERVAETVIVILWIAAFKVDHWLYASLLPTEGVGRFASIPIGLILFAVPTAVCLKRWKPIFRSVRDFLKD